MSTQQAIMIIDLLDQMNKSLITNAAFTVLCASFVLAFVLFYFFKR